MNVYDFDNTIFKGDSSVKFIKYSFTRHPFKVTYCFLRSLKYLLKKDIGLFKSCLFSFVKDINNIDEYIDKFVLKNQKNIKKFYLEQKKDDDLIISASFDFIISSFCKYLGVSCIATKYDIKNGSIIGKNCKGEEKIKRFKEIYKDTKMKESYSDSLSDKPLLLYASKSYLVKDEKLIPYKK